MREGLSASEGCGLSLILLTWAGLIAGVQKVDPDAFVALDLLKIHCASSVPLILGFQLYHRSWRTSLWIGNLCLHLCFPILGPVFALALVVSLALSPKMDLLADFHEEDKALRTHHAHEVEESLGDTIRKRVNVEPIVETIRSNAGVDLKRGAIETLTNIKNPHAVGLLKECLSDANSEVRFYASGGLSRIEEGLNADIISKKNNIKKMDHPSSNDFFELGKAYYEFIYLAIQDEASLRYYLDQSILNFEQAYQKEPKLTRYRQQLEKAYSRGGYHDKAKLLLQRQGASEERNLMYLAETHFKHADFERCQDTLAKVKAEDKKWEAIEDVMQLWELAKPQKEDSA